MKLYKVEITNYPAEALIQTEDGPIVDEAWAPANWLADDDERAAWVERHGDTRFFWPATWRLYRSRSGAKDRARLIESYGATVDVVESEPIVWLTPEIRRARRIEALEAELMALRTEQVAEIYKAGDAVVSELAGHLFRLGTS